MFCQIAVLPYHDVAILTITHNVGTFHIQVLREVLLWLGICDVSKRSIMHHLSKGPGSAVMIVVGGAAESLAGEYNLTLK